jgi:5-methylcytosine-specific restriction endonuclease McrA
LIHTGLEHSERICVEPGCTAQLVKKPGPGRWPKWCPEHRGGLLGGCSVAGCANRRHAKSLCVTHYNRAFGHDIGTCRREGRANEDPTKRHRSAGRADSLRRRTRFRRSLVHAGDAEEIDVWPLGERDDWVCGICDEPVDRELEYPDRMCATVDHVVPISKGGRHVWDNVQLAHFGCNMDKGAAVAS